MDYLSGVCNADRRRAVFLVLRGVSVLVPECNRCFVVLGYGLFKRRVQRGPTQGSFPSFLRGVSVLVPGVQPMLRCFGTGNYSSKIVPKTLFENINIWTNEDISCRCISRT